MRHEVRVLPNDGAELVIFSELLGVVSELQRDRCPSGGSGALGDGVGLATIRYPADRGSIGQRRETLDGHLISHHEGRVEPDTELANQGLGVLALLLQRLCEGRGAAASDGAEMLRVPQR